MLDAIIIGAGFSGLYQLHSLRDKLGLNCHLFEMGEEIGGTWYWNSYPGARCDTESHAYCYYFNEELYNKWTWTERYPGQVEIKNYLSFVAKELDLLKSISFSSKITRMDYIDNSNSWKIFLENGKVFLSRFVITAIGCLSKPNTPKINGLEKFKGQILHTAEWPKSKINFKGLKVAVFGTGSSGIQIIPEIAKEAKTLTVFQRTANYSIPAKNQSLSNDIKQKHKYNFDRLKNISIHNRHGHPWEHSNTPIQKSNLDDSYQTLNKAWEKGGLSFRDTFSNINYDSFANSVVSEFIKEKIENIVNDPSTLQNLIDFDHPFGAKRPALDTNYFLTFNKKNVRLINLKQTPVDEINTSGLKIGGEYIHLDLIVFATGFDAITGSLLKLNIKGKDGVKLSNQWESKPKNYLGLQIPDFPNLFTITGPGSPSVLTNMPRAIEQHVDWITKCISYLLENNNKKIEARHEFADIWLNTVEDEAKKTMFLKTKNSWYLGTNIEGKPKGFIPYSGGLNKYTNICNNVANSNYKGFLIS